MSGSPGKSQCSPCWPSPCRSVNEFIQIHPPQPVAMRAYRNTTSVSSSKIYLKPTLDFTALLYYFPNHCFEVSWKYFILTESVILYEFVGDRKQIPCRKGNHRLCPSQMFNPDWLFWTGWGAVGQTLQDIGSLQHMCCCKSVTRRGDGSALENIFLWVPDLCDHQDHQGNLLLYQIC